MIVSQDLTLQDLLAWQSRARGIIAPTIKSRTLAKQGVHSALSFGRGIEFAECRHYHPGDDIRHIDWRVTARSTKVHTKTYHSEQDCSVWLVTDLSPSMRFATRNAFKSVIAAHLAALHGWLALNQHDRTGGIVFNHYNAVFCPARSRKQGLLPYLNALVDFAIDTHDAECSYTLNDALNELSPYVQTGHAIVIISDFYKLEQVAQTLLNLRQIADISLWCVRDPIECAVPPPGQYPICDDTQAFILDLTGITNRKTYQAMIDEKNAALATLCETCALQPHYASTDEPPWQWTLSTLGDVP